MTRVPHRIGQVRIQLLTVSRKNQPVNDKSNFWLNVIIMQEKCNFGDNRIHLPIIACLLDSFHDKTWYLVTFLFLWRHVCHQNPLKVLHDMDLDIWMHKDKNPAEEYRWEHCHFLGPFSILYYGGHRKFRNPTEKEITKDLLLFFKI